MGLTPFFLPAPAVRIGAWALRTASIVAVGSWFAFIPSAVEAEREPPPDVLLVVIDDVALSDVAMVETPNLDWLASTGVSFSRAYAMPLCAPTRTTLLFGEYRGLDHGVTCAAPSVETPDHTKLTLPEVLMGLGYATAAFGKWHVGSNRLGPWEITPQLHGFDVWRAGSPENVKRCGGRSYEDWTRVDDGRSVQTTEYHTRAVRDAFLDWWQATPGPRFAYVAFQSCHVPFHTPPPDLLPRGHRTPVSRREQFEAMLVSVDIVLGQLFDVIDTRSTLIVVVGDNGTPPGAVRPDQDPDKVKATTFEDGVKVPLVVAGPGIRRSFTARSLVHVVDLFATIVELAGGRVPANAATDSVSFAPSLRGPHARGRAHVYCDVEPTTSGPIDPGGVEERDRAVITTRYKLRRVGDAVEVLYDLRLDPYEERPLDPADARNAEVLARLRRLLDAEGG